MQHTATPAVRVLLIVLMLAAAGPARTVAGDDLVLNAGAEQGKGDQPSVWFAAQVPAEGLRMWRDTTQARSGKACLAIANQHDYDQPVANNWAQSLQHVPAGKSLQVVAYIKTNNADAANVCLQCWDKSAETMLAFVSTPVVRGDQDWALLKSEPVVVPDATASIMVRAALTGKGEARFDDVAVTLVDAGTSPTQVGLPSKADAARPGQPRTAGQGGVDADLAAVAPGKIVAVRPVTKDTMVLAYLPDWNHGAVDNIAVAGNEGGVRMLMAWLPVTAEQATDPSRRFYLAIYSRNTRLSEDPGVIGVYPVAADWTEQASWKTQPKTDPASVSTAEFVPDDGWKLFDVTPVVRAKADKRGVMLRFEREDRQADWSGYQCVSREGAGEWKARRPVLLIVEPSGKAVAQTQKTAEPPRQ